MRNPMIESHLNELGIEWQYHESVSTARINYKKSLENQARIEEALNVELVRQYRDSMKSGSKFPAAVVYQDGPDYIGIDGNHRFEGFAQAKIKTIDLYEVKATPEDRMLLTYSLNTLNGRPQSEDDRDAHAVTLIHRGLKREVVSQTLNIPMRRVDEAIAIDKAHLRANQLGMKTPWSKIASKHARLELARGPEFQDDSVLTEMILLTAKYRLGRKEIRAIRDKVGLASSESARLSVLQDERKTLETAAAVAAGGNAKRLGNKNERGMMNAHAEYIIKHNTEGLKHIFPGLTVNEISELRARFVAVLEEVTANIAYLDGKVDAR